MTITLNSKDGFDPAGNLGGKKGLHKKLGSHSCAMLNGTGLGPGMIVTVISEPSANKPTLVWTGATDSSSLDAQAMVDLTVVQVLQLDNKERHRLPTDDPTTVSVTVTNGTDTSAPITPTVTTGD
jgi:hypothetical protein